MIFNDETIALERALYFLETRIESPANLVALWQFTSNFTPNAPSVEIVQPWYKGLENLIHLK